MRKTGYVLCLGLLLSGFGAHALADEGVDAISKTSFGNGIVHLPGSPALTEYSLPLSNGRVRVPPGFILLRGEAARQRLFPTQGTPPPDVDAELVVGKPPPGGGASPKPVKLPVNPKPS